MNGYGARPMIGWQRFFLFMDIYAGTVWLAMSWNNFYTGYYGWMVFEAGLSIFCYCVMVRRFAYLRSLRYGKTEKQI